MCGLCGIIDFSGRNERELSELILQMTSTLNHRGPDETGTWHDHDVALGHARLKIIDLVGSKQPMVDALGRYVLVFNGEIYNFLQLREELASRGTTFQTTGDTEVLLYSFATHKEGCLKSLNGMFAFAAWDRRDRKLFLARDRMGQKPLYYYHDDHFFAFGSEIKSILSVPGINRELDVIALDNYLKYGFISAPRTAYKKIKKLPPAHCLVYDGKKTALNKYWHIPFPSSPNQTPIAESATILREELEKAVRLRLVSDVPLGAFLSGGIDSTVITALMGLLESDVKTFCVGFEEDSYDERSHSKIVAERFKTNHTEYILEDYEVESLLPKLISHFDEPFGDSSALPTFHLSRITRKSVTVALSGDGGDELFGGYSRYVGRRLAYYYNQLPRLLRERFLKRFIAMFPDNSRYYAKSIIKKAKLFINMASRIDKGPLEVLPVVFGDAERERLLAPDFAAQVANLASEEKEDEIIKFSRQFSRLDEISHMMWVDLHTYLPDDILVKVDRMSMAHSLEVRSPFMDHNIVEFVCSLPVEQKLKGLTTKYILRKAFENTIPQDVIKRPKQGFAVPLAAWFRGKLRELAHDSLIAGDLSDFLDREYIKRILLEHQHGRCDNSHNLWILLIFAMWKQLGIRNR